MSLSLIGELSSSGNLYGVLNNNIVKSESTDYVTEESLKEKLSEIIQDKAYMYEKSIASNTWDISHNLNKIPSVTVVDSSGNVVIGEINYKDFNNLQISFSGAFSGKAYLN